MPHKSKTPADTGASRDSFAGLSLPTSTTLAIQAQFLIAGHHVRPELAAMIAALAFKGGDHG
ncbi:hypothetical protein [Croceicoccus sp. YJ47]|uniref:hypothetical protein n=1 Tax=Croceicoccus sp. YJ47 TaxID=2798724 RepID=UPI0019226103|nr:hypothetical protein [Croceicoccus sp. YJ47]QQN74165.1 hypothetical protein JD971_15830 [Croceicoccus sp. YJ47]